MPQISVIVPIYRAEKYIERCVNSILNQTFRDIEVILVDDGSPDKCPEICEQYAKKDSRVRVLHKENGGVSTARNAGLDIAKGEYIIFVDSDDYLELNMYEKMINKALEYECDVVMCDCLKEYEDRSELFSHNIRAGFYNREQLESEYYSHLLIMENVEYPATISNWLLLWKNKLNTSEMRYESGIRYSEDLLFGAEILLNANSFYYMKGETYYHYVMNPSSASHTYVSNKWDDYEKLYKKIKETFSNYDRYDFSYQIDLCLLFFVYNAIGDYYKAPLTIRQKREQIRRVLMTPSVRKMFKCLDISRIRISKKQKLITLSYKYKIGLLALIIYYGKK